MLVVANPGFINAVITIVNTLLHFRIQSLRTT